MKVGWWVGAGVCQQKVMRTDGVWSCPPSVTIKSQPIRYYWGQEGNHYFLIKKTFKDKFKPLVCNVHGPDRLLFLLQICQFLLRNMVWECSFNRVVNRLQWESSDLRAFSKCIITYRRRHLATSKHVINITQSIEMFSSQT